VEIETVNMDVSSAKARICFVAFVLGCAEAAVRKGGGGQLASVFSTPQAGKEDIALR
jgi:hypothetical protein